MDNRQFNINGDGKDMLIQTLRLAFAQEGRNTTCKGYLIDPKKGMILLWVVTEGSKATLLPAPFDADQMSEFVWTWLRSNPEIECIGWDADADHDGDNHLGWRVYCEDWGYVGTGEPHNHGVDDHYAIVAVKPCYLWYGK